ncbi:hypothetical protein [Leifsonia sp. NCR5]|uniref:hypothetical protein n=1 Tax=Leifsonia sp. NCR5 TaxID=1978342 RepID=UPI0015C4E51A|nr:hypothetical protein [Leifsonia sp. NCR5]
MSTIPSGRPTQQVADASHFEQSISGVTGELIRIECDCPIGEDHTYADWLARFTRAGF